jgi:hypothetical protein
MKNVILFLTLATVMFGYVSHAQTITSAGNWDNTGIWTAGNIGDVIGESATFNNSIGTVTIRNGFSYVIGGVDMVNGNTLTIDLGGSLTVGASGNPFDLKTGNTATINVAGDLTIWGDLDIGNSLILNVTGTLTIKGNLKLGNGGALTIAGNVTVDGSFVGGNNTDLDVSGSVAIAGSFSVGNGSTAVGTGTVAVGGTCTDGSSSVCTSGPLPVELTSFQGYESNGKVNLEWSTATEENNDYYSIEKSQDGVNYELIATMPGAGNSTSVLEYTYIDSNPLLGRSYYRLKQTDFDGASETFKPIAVDFTTLAEGKLSFGPNPVNRGEKITIETQTYGDEILNISVYNMVGEVVLSNEFTGSTFEFNLDHATRPGVYFIKVSSVKSQKTGRLLVR